MAITKDSPKHARLQKRLRADFIQWLKADIEWAQRFLDDDRPLETPGLILVLDCMRRNMKAEQIVLRRLESLET